MAENDIYNSKAKYEKTLKNLNGLLIKPPYDLASAPRGARRYYCKNRANLEHFHTMAKLFEARDLSYIRRVRVLNVLKLIVHSTSKNLKDCDRTDVNSIVAFAHQRLPSPNSKKDFIKDIKFLWKNLFPELDEKDRPDENLTPYTVRHLSGRIDRSKEKLRADKLNYGEFEKLVQSFSDDIRMQAFLTLEFETLGRPQETLYVRIGDVEIHDNYARIWISSHGKEGTGFLQCIESYPYVVEWYNAHPLKHDPEAYFFINLGNTGKYMQLKPSTINKHLRDKLKLLKINKPVTCYSLKRNGVTHRRLRGDSDATIQHVARWKSTKQLSTYDLSEPQDMFNLELAKRGLIKSDNGAKFSTIHKKCGFCEMQNNMTDSICTQCKRPLDRTKLVHEASKEGFARGQDNTELRDEFDKLKSQFNAVNLFMNKVVEANPQILDMLAEEAKNSSDVPKFI